LTERTDPGAEKTSGTREIDEKKTAKQMGAPKKAKERGGGNPAKTEKGKASGWNEIKMGVLGVKGGQGGRRKDRKAAWRGVGGGGRRHVLCGKGEMSKTDYFRRCGHPMKGEKTRRWKAQGTKK